MASMREVAGSVPLVKVRDMDAKRGWKVSMRYGWRAASTNLKPETTEF